MTEIEKKKSSKAFPTIHGNFSPNIKILIEYLIVQCLG